MVLANSCRISRVPHYLGDCRGRAITFAYRTFTFSGSPFQGDSASDRFCDSRKPLQRPPRSSLDPDVATLAGLHHTGLGCSVFARRYSRNRGCFLFLRVLRCFSSPGWLPPAYEFSRRIPRDEARGLPHSEIPGSKLVCSSPRLIAAYHVLLRLLEPRHSPCALRSLTKILERGFRLWLLGQTLQLSKSGPRVRFRGIIKIRFRAGSVNVWSTSGAETSSFERPLDAGPKKAARSRRSRVLM